MNKVLEIKVLSICEKLLPKTSEYDNKEIIKLLADIRKSLET
jgi:hypothetical protein